MSADGRLISGNASPFPEAKPFACDRDASQLNLLFQNDEVDEIVVTLKEVILGDAGSQILTGQLGGFLSKECRFRLKSLTQKKGSDGCVLHYVRDRRKRRRDADAY